MKDLSRNDWLKFEVYIAEVLENLKVDSGSDLTDVAQELHYHIESAIQDYAYDENIIDDYEASY